MNSKQRVKRTVNFEKVDRIPAGLFGTHTEYEEGLAEYIGVNSIEEMYKELKIDIWHCKEGLEYTKDDSIWQFEGDPPFAEVDSIKEVEKVSFPEIENFKTENLEREIKEHQQFAVCGGINSAIFHHYLNLCGQENALCYLKIKPDIAKAIIRKITDFWVDYLETVLKVGKGKIDLIENCNDFGTQRSLFISTEDFREFFKPQLRRLYDKAKEYDVLYMQHSCGAIFPIIHDFIEMGADILNPIQTAAAGMDIKKLKSEFKGKIALYGGVDTQHLLPKGPEELIRDEVKNILNIFGKNGGYILSGAQGLIEDIPYNHAETMLKVPR